MEVCTFTSQIAAYHDGELPAEEGRRMEQHVEACPACRAELESLRSVSDIFRESDSKDLKPMELARLHLAVSKVEMPEESPLRLFGGLLAVAASILVVCGAWWYEAPRVVPGTTVISPEIPAWERLAMDLQDIPDPIFGREATAAAESNLAEWMLRGMTNRENRGEPTHD